MSPLPRVFIPGQCWTSEAEPELGIGFVREKDAQTVTLEFPLASEARRYGVRTAPLKRLEFREGDTIHSAGGRRLSITRVEDREGVLWYHGVQGEALAESELSPKLRIQRPLQRFQAGHWDSLKSYDLRQQALGQAARVASSPVRGLMGPRARLLPHQLHVASQVAARALPRALLADEVGLGKTIEAGWILHQLIARGRARRALVIVPQALVNQWFIELLKRFHLSFWVPSSQSDEPMTAEDILEQERLILATSALSDPVVAEGLRQAEWDLVIVDEAHRIAADSPEYATLRDLARRSPGLLLLTATPEQLGLEGHFARLQLIDPARFASWESYLSEHARYKEVLERAEALLGQGDSGRCEALELVDRHGTGRIYFRNSRRVVGQEGYQFPKRRLVSHPIPQGGLEKWLGEFASEHRTGKTLLICSTAARAASLEKRLKEDFAVKAVAFHENLPLLARDRNAAYFADPDGASILLASEIGGEGRNFQHAHRLVLPDLPEDPDVLEQRIGRLDRIGQLREIEIHVPHVASSREERLLRWHRDVYGAFESPVQGASALHARYAGTLGRLLETVGPEGERAFAEAAERARGEYLEILSEIEAGRDRLIELQSFDPAAASSLASEVARAERPDELRELLDALFDTMGLRVEDLDADTMFVEAGDSAFASYVPALPPEGMRFTFSREKAVARDDLALMTWDHPLVTGLLESMASQELGNTSVAAWSSELKPHPLAVECRFAFETSCDPRWNLGEFFAPAPMRVMLEGNGTELTDAWPADTLREQIGPLSPKLASVARRIPADALKRLLLKARVRAEERADDLRDEALGRMERAIARELERLEALRAKNGLVSEAEVRWWKDRGSALTEALQGAQARLDAFLLILPATLGR